MTNDRGQPFDIAIAVPGLPFNGHTAINEGLGGSETAGYYMARELAKLGHHVRVFCNCNVEGHGAGVFDDVRYFPMQDWEAFSQMVPHDVSIVQRLPDMFASPKASKLNWLWCHDLALGRQKPEVMGILWNVDRILVLSEYMRNQYQSTYGLDEGLMLTRNGIDLSLFNGLQNIRRHKNRMVYAARPERGVDNLLKHILPEMLKRKDVEIHLCGYSNTTEHMKDYYSQIDSLIHQYGNRVVWHGSLSKRKLYELYASCGVYAYPTPSENFPDFAEISCISLMEAQACGLPTVTSIRGALPETLDKNAGALIDGDPWTSEYINEFCDQAERLMTDSDIWDKASQAGKEKAKSYSWAAVAKEWAIEIEKQIRELSKNQDTLGYHFWKHSDIQAARALKDISPVLRKRIEEDWKFTENEDTYKAHYENIGLTHGPLIEHHVEEARFKLLEDWLKHRPEGDRIIDYGCAYGSYLLNMVKRIPNRQWIGIDVDKNGLALAEQHKDKMLTEEEKKAVRFLSTEREDYALFKTGPKDIDTKAANVLILFEVLEHVTEPTELIDKVEKLVEPGGRIIITVPYGPWEYASYHTYPYRCHLWEFDWHDLRDMFSQKDGLTIAPIYQGVSEYTKEPLGWWLVEYVVTGKPTGRINMERKLWLQRPQQTVSASIMAGENAEENLHWCLKSLNHVIDELIIVDCGMNEEAKRIVNEYTKWYRGDAKVIEGPDPKQAGFETPRNIGLHRCSKDWILWLDTDEKLLGSYSIHKYLRNNPYNGYSIKQCHFACDTTFTPDTPVRLFRRLYHGEQKMQFYGCIHEHPELGLNEGPGRVVSLGDVWIPHVGYLDEATRRGRFARNYPLLEKDMVRYPDRLLQKHFIMRDKMLLCMHDIQANGGKLTDEIKQRAKEVIAIYRKHFRGRSVFSNVDPLEYYSQACQILGLGTEVAFQIAAAKTGIPELNGTKHYRFASQEDLETELLRMARDHVGELMTQEW